MHSQNCEKFKLAAAAILKVTKDTKTLPLSTYFFTTLDIQVQMELPSLKLSEPEVPHQDKMVADAIFSATLDAITLSFINRSGQNLT